MDFLEVIARKLKPENRAVIGIDGLSRSGKTTSVLKFSRMLEERNICYKTIHIDDHIVEKKQRYNTGYEQWQEYYYMQWDVMWLRENLFEKLRKVQTLKLPFYDEKMDQRILQEIELHKTDVILIEGVFLQREEWREFFDYVIYLDCPREKRFLRESQLTQKLSMKFKERYWPAEEYYMKTVTPLVLADDVIRCSEKPTLPANRISD